jgi:NAD(P)-dependent dehydrogenase (short-subunit alcohol dehydrogenase family)
MEMNQCAAIITGGASGMGAATAEMLSRAGVKIAILDLNVESAQIIAQKVKGMAISCDVTQPDSVKEAIHKAEESHGAARICINCAGIVHGRRMVNQQGAMPLDEFRKVIEINLIGTFNVMSQSAERMIPLSPIGDTHERGIIINTTSIAAFEGQIGQTAYSASKGGIVSLILPAARELAQFGIRVMGIAPGLVDTPMFEKLSETARASLAASIPFPKRLATPQEFAFLVKHIIKNTMLNGEVIRLDGALRMSEK